jgi:hypothetical protein
MGQPEYGDAREGQSPMFKELGLAVPEGSSNSSSLPCSNCHYCQFRFFRARRHCEVSTAAFLRHG